MDVSLVFAVVAAIIIIGFAGELFFKKTGIPIFIFLILTGIILGPALNVFPREPLLPALEIFAELTLLMVLFYGGMGMKFSSVLTGGLRAFVQTVVYVISSMTIIGFFGVLIMKWDILPSFIFASMIGGETTAAVVVPLSRSMKLSEATASFLTLESAMNSIFSIVFFFAFSNIYIQGGNSWLAILSSIASQFSVGIVLGALLSLAWIFMLDKLQKEKFTYMLTLGLILITYSLATQLGGNGTLAVLVFSIILGNYYLVNKLFRRQISMDFLQSRLLGFQEEITFLMETLFFVFLGLTFLITPSLFFTNLLLGVLFLCVLLAVRSAATRISTFGSEMRNERRAIVLLCAQGLTPATLGILAVSLHIPLADTFLNVVTYIIILTNVVTTIGSFINMKKQE